MKTSCTLGLPACVPNKGRAGLGTTIRAVALLAIVGGTAGSGLAPASAAEPDPAGVEFFEKKVRPILAQHCYSCHSSEAEKLRGGLLLDRATGWLEGGDSGPALVPGNPDESLIVLAVRHDDELLKMPPKVKLADAEVETLTQWVKRGAPAPADAEGGPVAKRPAIDLEKARAFWAFQPPATPELPEVGDEAWPRTEIDRFILAGLEAKGLAPAAPADKRTLIRRATFDLTGLPPTPAEIEAFLADDAPEAFARVVDRLLASPQYGERWGRHWLDVARYADSNGLDENVAHGNAWRYRDYVVEAFNADKPYDQFVVEQVAGDLLPPTGDAERDHARLIATGFLSMGPKVLAEPDKGKLEMDIVDEQMDTLGRAFMGLTIGCARCHDHKFDPILTADYYGMAGIFKSTKTMESLKTVAKWNEHSLASEEDLARKAAHDKEVEAKKAEVAAFIKATNETLTKEGGEGFKLPKMPETAYPEGPKAELKRLRDELAALEAAAPELPSAMGVTEGEVADTKIHVRGSHQTLGEVVPRRIPVVLADDRTPAFEEKQSGRLELARWMVEPGHPLTGRVMVNRIWRWHFGRGLVGTPDNFGALGERPTNQPLLDWMATRFRDGGWSVKAMHRLIMLSRVYQQSSEPDSRAAAVDPENTLHWRANVRRLEAESIRDALLAVGGSLDRTMGGSLLRVKNRGYFFNHTSQDNTEYDSLRRSIYLPVVRNHLYDMFELFDSTDASVTNGDRPTTTVAPQALFMMNSDLILQAAEGLAADLLGRPGLDDLGRINLLYERAYGRPPTGAEAGRALIHLGRLDATIGGKSAGRPSPEAWQALCQVVLASNEFIHIR